MKNKLLLILFLYLFSSLNGQEIKYLNPGTIFIKEGNLEGGDYLKNLQDNLTVFIEIVRPEAEEKNIVAEDAIMEWMITGLEKKGISIEQPNKEAFNLPFIHLLVMYYPIQDQLTAYISARLFERVDVERITLSGKAAIQGITWERQQLIVAPKNLFQEEVKKTVVSMMAEFTEKYAHVNKGSTQKVDPPLLSPKN
jgi:hypothetical protein